MSFCQSQLEAVRPLWDRMLSHRFLLRTRDGEIPDDAFAKLPAGSLKMLLEPENRETLVAILTYHVSPGSLKAADVASMDRIETLNGQSPRVVVDSKGVMVGDARVTSTDIMASNGVIHVIDAVIVPENLLSSAPHEAGEAVAAHLR